MERFGFVGLPNAGKSSLFNSLTGGGAYAAPYAFATTAPNVGVARVPDPRLDRVAEMSRSRRAVAATVQFTDIGGLVAGASRGEGLGNAFLAHIREVDAIVFVLRAFPGIGVSGSTDPLDHLQVLEIELALADMASSERQLDKISRLAKADSSLEPQVALLRRVLGALEQGTPLYRAGLTDSEMNRLRFFFLLTAKPVLAVVNIGEDRIGFADELVAPVRAAMGGAEVIPLCVQLEAEAAQLDVDARVEMLDGLGLGAGVMSRFLTSAYRLLGLETFLTTGEKESRAWTFRSGSTAPECAGVIHSDFQRGFIRADVIGWNDLVAAESWVAARGQGKVRSEGKDYVVIDGDVLDFKFSPPSAADRNRNRAAGTAGR